jgi:hypothetical protein
MSYVKKTWRSMKLGGYSLTTLTEELKTYGIKIMEVVFGTVVLYCPDGYVLNMPKVTASSNSILFVS